MMDHGGLTAFSKRCMFLFVGILLGFSGLMIGVQGCADMDRYVVESQRERGLKHQMKLAEDELRKGNLIAARTLFEWVRKESKRSATQERALFFSGFCALFDKNSRHRWERAEGIFLDVSEGFPQGEFGQISGYVAAGLSDALSVTAALQRDIESMRQEMDLERSHAGERDRLVQKQKKQLLQKTEQIAALKRSIKKKNEEIENLRLQIKKLEEIHEEIKKKRKDLS